MANVITPDNGLESCSWNSAFQKSTPLRRFEASGLLYEDNRGLTSDSDGIGDRIINLEWGLSLQLYQLNPTQRDCDMFAGLIGGRTVRAMEIAYDPIYQEAKPNSTHIISARLELEEVLYVARRVDTVGNVAIVSEVTKPRCYVTQAPEIVVMRTHEKMADILYKILPELQEKGIVKEFEVTRVDGDAFPKTSFKIRRSAVRGDPRLEHDLGTYPTIYMFVMTLNQDMQDQSEIDSYVRAVTNLAKMHRDQELKVFLYSKFGDEVTKKDYRDNDVVGY